MNRDTSPRLDTVTLGPGPAARVQNRNILDPMVAQLNPSLQEEGLGPMCSRSLGQICSSSTFIYAFLRRDYTIDVT